MLVRPANPDDVPRLMDMLRDFHAASCYSNMVDFCPASVLETFKNLSISGNHVLLVGEVDGTVVAMAAAVSTAHWGNRSHIVGQELFWWCDPSHRKSRIGIMLLAGLEQWAFDVGCATLSLASTATLKAKALARFYRQRGYIAQDVFYAKRITHHA